MQTQEIFFDSSTATLFYSSFVWKNIFYSENIQYVYGFYTTDLYINICRDVFRTQLNIYGGAKCQCFSDIIKIIFKNLSLIFLLLELIKNMLVYEEGIICFRVFCCCCRLWNKNTISPKRIMFLYCIVNFEHNFSAFSLNILFFMSHFSLSVIQKRKHDNDNEAS